MFLQINNLFDFKNDWMMLWSDLGGNFNDALTLKDYDASVLPNV